MPQSKAEIRRAAKMAVKALSSEQRNHKSALIFNNIANLEQIVTAKVVALYASLPDEVDSRDFIDRLAATKRVVLPRVAGDDMDFYDYRADELVHGAFGIAEPQNGEAVDPQEIDVIVVPGVAFTRDGIRCGRGKGYYDKYLSREGFRATKIGICYSEQITESIPTEPHDIRMDCVVWG